MLLSALESCQISPVPLEVVEHQEPREAVEHQADIDETACIKSNVRLFFLLLAARGRLFFESVF